MQCWRDRCEGLGMKLLYLCGGKLVVERNNPPRSSLVTEQCFADDAIITASTREDITKATMELKQVTNEYGLTVSFPKTKLLLVVGTGITDTDNNLASLSIGIVVLMNQYIPSFRYLGLFVEGHGGVALNLDGKIAGASKVLEELLESLFLGQLHVKTDTEMICQAVMLGILLYTAET